MERQNSIQVFISSVAADARWCRRVLLYLKSLNHGNGICVFNQASILPGSDIKSAVHDALNDAAVAVALVSTSYLASEEIWSGQLPLLISAVRLKGLRLLPVIVHACPYEQSLLASFHPFNSPTKPLSSMTPSGRRAELVRLSNLIVEPAATRLIPRDSAQLILTEELLNDSTAYLKSVRARRFIRTLPLGLERELATHFFNVADVQRVIENGARILEEAFPCVPGAPVATALPLSYVTLSNGARVAWESTVSEAARVGPLALAAILLAARTETDNDLPVLKKTLSMILAKIE